MPLCLRDSGTSRHEYRPLKSLVSALVAGGGNEESLAYEFAVDVLAAAQPQLHLIGERLFRSHASGEINEPLDRFFNILLHMHCNRLFGIDLRAERRTRAFLYHVLEAQQRKDHQRSNSSAKLNTLVVSA